MAGMTSALIAVMALGLVVVASGRETASGSAVGFSHRVHAGENKIPCLYCHVNARRSSIAGIPSVERCMGCHKITAANKEEVQKLKGYWDRKEPIPWPKVTWLPDFVFFQHWPHVRDGIQCETCHGPVETMDRMRQAKDLSMKFCVNCHRQKKASIDCATCHR